MPQGYCGEDEEDLGENRGCSTPPQASGQGEQRVSAE